MVERFIRVVVPAPARPTPVGGAPAPSRAAPPPPPPPKPAETKPVQGQASKSAPPAAKTPADNDKKR